MLTAAISTLRAVLRWPSPPYNDTWTPQTPRCRTVNPNDVPIPPPTPDHDIDILWGRIFEAGRLASGPESATSEPPFVDIETLFVSDGAITNP